MSDSRHILLGVTGSIAAYKAPKSIVRVETFLRSPNGKSDYRWAQAEARRSLGLD